MENGNQIKAVVKEKYGEIAVKSAGKKSSGCACGCGPETTDYSVFADDYQKLSGYVADADLGLGCGLPTEYAGIKEGDVVVDLGAGAGNDVFIARSFVGDSGKVIGIDMTEAMIEKANKNNQKLGYGNVEFKLGDIENLPIENNSADVVISNCVLNLVPDKNKAFAEMYRIIKPGGHFSVSDIVLIGELPKAIKKSAEMYAGCVSGAIDQNEYLGIITKSGFRNVEVKKSKSINLPDEVLSEYLNEEELKEFKTKNIGIFSITVNGYK
jgi:arsenite methyltransferase